MLIFRSTSYVIYALDNLLAQHFFWEIKPLCQSEKLFHHHFNIDSCHSALITKSWKSFLNLIKFRRRRRLWRLRTLWLVIATHLEMLRKIYISEVIRHALKIWVSIRANWELLSIVNSKSFLMIHRHKLLCFVLIYSKLLWKELQVSVKVEASLKLKFYLSQQESFSWRNRRRVSRSSVNHGID